MSGTLQTLTSAYHVVAIAYELACLVKKVVRAKPEAQRWLDHCEDIEAIARGIRAELKIRVKDREDGYSPTKHEIAIENVLRRSVRKCEKCLREMKDKLQPLSQLSDDNLLRSVPDRIKFVFDQDFIDAQQTTLDRQIRNISLGFHLLESSDRRSERVQRRAESARVQRIEQTLVLLEQRMTQHLERTTAGAGGSANHDITELDGIDDLAPDELPPTHRPTAEPRGRLPMTGNIENDDDDDEISIGSQSDLDSDDSRSVSRVRILQALRDPLLEAVRLKNVEAARTYLADKEDSELQIYDGDGWTLLHHAILAQFDIMQMLLQRSSIQDPRYLNATNKQGQTALMDAAKRADRKNGLEFVKILLKHDCDVNARDNIGRTALYFNVSRPPGPHSDEVLRLLMSKGCDIAPLTDSNIQDRIKLYPPLKERVDSIQKQDIEYRPRRSTLSRLTRTLTR